VVGWEQSDFFRAWQDTANFRPMVRGIRDLFDEFRLFKLEANAFAMATTSEKMTMFLLERRSKSLFKIF
jgi:hypothetical protein